MNYSGVGGCSRLGYFQNGRIWMIFDDFSGFSRSGRFRIAPQPPGMNSTQNFASTQVLEVPKTLFFIENHQFSMKSGPRPSKIPLGTTRDSLSKSMHSHRIPLGSPRPKYLDFDAEISKSLFNYFSKHIDAQDPSSWLNFAKIYYPNNSAQNPCPKFPGYPLRTLDLLQGKSLSLQ